MECDLKHLHFIVLPFPAQGHLSPLLNLSNTLLHKGAFVTIANIEPVHKQLQSNAAFPSSTNVKLVGLPFPFDAPTGVNSHWYHNLREFAVAVSKLAGAIENLVRETTSQTEFRKYVLISDHFLSCRDIAHKYGASFVNYWPGTAHWCVIHLHLGILASKGDIPVTGKHFQVISPWILQLLSMLLLPGVEIKLADLPKYCHLGNPESVDPEFFKHIAARAAACSSSSTKGDWFFVNSVLELEPGAFDVLKKLLGSRCVSAAPLFHITHEQESGEFIQPAASFSLKNEDSSCMEWLDAQEDKSVLYVSFGSIAPLNEAEVQALADGLERSKHKFLWVVKEEHFPQVCVDIFRDFLIRVKSTQQGLVIAWAPQRQVLAHRAVGGFLSHCGWNSVFESISEGVPIIGWPCISEQRLNCKLVVEDWKLGMRVKNNEEVQKTVCEFMRMREVFEKNAAAAKNIVKASVLGGGSSNKSLCDFLRAVAE